MRVRFPLPAPRIYKLLFLINNLDKCSYHHVTLYVTYLLEISSSNFLVIAPSFAIFPLTPARNTVLSVLWPASRVRARVDQFGLCQKATRAPARDWIILCDCITNPLLLSIPQGLNLGGIFRTIFHAQLFLSSDCQSNNIIYERTLLRNSFIK